MSVKEETRILSVSELTRQVKNLLEADIGEVWVAGEISNWRVSPAGHAYFTLKDDSSQVSAVMFRGQTQRLRFKPGSGLEVLVFGLVTVYEVRGNYQIICKEMQPKGVGALQLAFEQLKKKLSAEGLFDEAHKKPLPMLPRRIGIVTSPSGAAIRDILNVIGRRFANVHVLLYPVRVQGDEASPEIAAAIKALDGLGVDVMIVGRGGGSLEDLWPFNEEIVVRAVHAAKTPIISAVGHEVDFTLCDFAADLRAPTPSAAAELVVREQQALLDTVQRLHQRLAKAMGHTLERARHGVALACQSYVLQRPEELVRQRRQQADEIRMRLDAAANARFAAARQRLDKAVHGLALLSPGNQVKRAHERLESLRFRLLRSGLNVRERSRARLQPVVGRLDALSPLKILSRGYSLARRLPNMDLVRDARQLEEGDKVMLTFGRGSATTVVEHIEEAVEGDGGTQV